MAARVDPRHVRARHQSMHHFVANAPWDDAAVLRVACSLLSRMGPGRGERLGWRLISDGDGARPSVWGY
jgi:SRSO17 transposase